MANGKADSSLNIASAMGAKVTLASPEKGMYLVTGKNSALESLVKTCEGEIVLRIGIHKMIVTLPFSGYLSLKDHHQIARIGPVTIDIERFNSVTGMLKKSG